MLSTFILLLAGAMTTAPSPKLAAVHVMKVTARDYAFDAPDTVLAGRTEIRLSNRGKELHHVWLVRLDAGKTAADFFAAMQKGGPQPTWARDAWARTVLCPAESPLPSLISRRAISSLPA